MVLFTRLDLWILFRLLFMSTVTPYTMHCTCRVFWSQGTSNGFTEAGEDCPSGDFGGDVGGGYVLAHSCRTGLLAVLESPDRPSDKKSCMMFEFNLPVCLRFLVYLCVNLSLQMSEAPLYLSLSICPKETLLNFYVYFVFNF